MTSADRPLTIMLTTRQFLDHGDRFQRVAPDARFLHIDIDGTVREGDVEIDRDNATADIAFGSTDLFDGAHRDENIRHFFGWLIRAELDWFHIAAAGTDNPVFGMLLDGGVRLTTSHHTAVPIAEYVLAQVLRHRLPIADMDRAQSNVSWEQHHWSEVAASRWLVVGMGSIGCEVARRAQAFGAHVTGVRRTPVGDEPVDAMIGPDAVVSALADHDVVVLAVPATEQTTGMADHDFFAAMQPDTIFVNVGRGQLVDEDALRAALDAATPRVAVLDVASQEPLPSDHWLWAHPAVSLTGHTSAGSHQRYDRAAAVFEQNLARFVAGDELADEIRKA